GETSVDWVAAARLCTQLGRVTSSGELGPLLRDAAKLLGARGLIVWTWDAGASELRPSIVHGYSDKVRARLRPVSRDADNATAAAFRSEDIHAVAGTDNSRAALAVPLLSAAGCAGVLAMELPNGREERASVRATATFIAAVLAQLISGPDSHSESRPESDSRPLPAADVASRTA
ncbi:MAG: GAF domain-containing protein, partial [Vicinamibacterales bacterium]